MSERAFSFLRVNEREGKPRTRGITEIRGPYYTPLGKRYLEDLLETMGDYVDSLKFAGGSFTLMPKPALKEIIDLAHRSNVLVSTGGFIEHVLTQGAEAVHRYIQECRDVGFDILEISSGFITIPTDDWLRLVERVQQVGLKAKPEVGIQLSMATLRPTCFMVTSARAPPRAAPIPTSNATFSFVDQSTEISAGAIRARYSSVLCSVFPGSR
jgi:phosphosulfolactate synthase (CoM biosynthesis protein A)